MARIVRAVLLAPLLVPILLTGTTGCGRQRPADADPSESQPGAAFMHSSRPAVLRALVGAPAETTHVIPSHAAMVTVSDYASLDALHDAMLAILHRAVNPVGPATRMSRGAARFKYWYAPDSASGWAFQIEVRDTSTCPQDAIGSALEASGWMPAIGYSADGPDGTVMGYVSGSYLCVVEGQWDGGDDSDPTYVPDPGCRVTVTCVPRRMDDVPPP